MSPDQVRLSVLDLVPVRSDQTTRTRSPRRVSLARVADELGYRRYWLAEHHNMPAVAATNPPVLIAMVAAATERIRVGSGGVMLPNHAPLVVAEQFALLEAAHPGRIDLGIGRAPGTDPVTSWALRHGGGGVEDDAVAALPGVRRQRHRDDVARRRRAPACQRRTHLAARDPAGHVGAAGVWLLGSSDYSARLAAEQGLPYVFAHHFSGQGTAEALALYRATFQPSPYASPSRAPSSPSTSCVAETEEEAERLARPRSSRWWRCAPAAPSSPQLTVEEAAEVALPPEHEDLARAMRERWVVGSPEAAPGPDRRARGALRGRRGHGPPGGRVVNRDRPAPVAGARGHPRAAGPSRRPALNRPATRGPPAASAPRAPARSCAPRPGRRRTAASGCRPTARPAGSPG